ncbi:alpha/beta hydrolase [Consotaella aegiceratis]|uniref:alpha/beta hydrolase n=1 Tax=Consotaella aegiceratis TaxID=3097961 RepID=UPI002F4068D9
MGQPRPLLCRRDLLLGAALAATGLPFRVAQARYVPAEASYRIFMTQPQSHRLDRFFVAEGDRRYQIFRAIPRQSKANDAHPVIYMLDGNAVFDRLTAEILEQVPGLAVVGIGYDTPLLFDADQRTLDYTPPLGSDGPVPDPTSPGRLSGGADAFLARLKGPLQQAAEADLAVDAGRRALWGHSYGGLFALYCLLRQPTAFRRYAAISPSITWGDDVLEPLMAIPRRADDEPAREVLIAYGDSERRLAPGEARPAKPSVNAEHVERQGTFAARLAETANATVRTEQLTGLGHGETFAASFAMALALAAAPLE